MTLALRAGIEPARERILAGIRKALELDLMKLLYPMLQALRRSTWPLQRQMVRLMYPPGTQASDFLQPAGEAAWVAADSVSWRVFGNPVAMFVGGVAAVVLELSEPRVRTGVWEHTTFAKQPLLRLQRTGHAAMMTVFGAHSRTRAMILRVNERHARIGGQTPSGVPYRADDPDLLAWVHATAAFGFIEAYARCVQPLSVDLRDRCYAEGQAVSRLYGVVAPPSTQAQLQQFFERMQPALERSGTVVEFLEIMARAPLLPRIARPLQRLLLRTAVQCVPAPTRELLGLVGPRWAVSRWQWIVVRALGRFADHLDHPELPAMLARQRLQLRD